MLTIGMPISLIVLALICWQGSAVQWWHWTLFCMGSSFMSLAQPAVAMVFPKEQAGRALAAYNLVIFGGVFVVQWGIGLTIDAFKGLGLSTPSAFRAAMAVFLLCALAGYLRFVLDNSAKTSKSAL